MSLVSDDDIYAHLDLVAVDDDPNGVVVDIRDSVEELLSSSTGQTFNDMPVVITDEVYDGTGLSTMYSRRPIDEISAIKFRYLPEIVQETFFVVDITNGITFRSGTRRIHSRIMPFPIGRDNVLLSYTASINAPSIAVLAVKEATASIYRGRGSEDARSEQKGTFQHVLIRDLKELKFWPKALELLIQPSIG